jgi:hypothetical protein
VDGFWKFGEWFRERKNAKLKKIERARLLKAFYFF